MSGLEADEAARLAGMSTRSFLTQMSKLNGSPGELRLPKEPGKRAHTYDEARLRAWIASGKPLPGPRTAPVHADAAAVEAQASWDGRSWSLRAAGIETSSTKLADAADSLRTTIARDRGAEPSDVALDLRFEGGLDAVRLWDDGRQLRKESDDMRKHAAQLQHEACVVLAARGISQADIAVLFGVSRPLIQRTLSG